MERLCPRLTMDLMISRASVLTHIALMNDRSIFRFEWKGVKVTQRGISCTKIVNVYADIQFLNLKRMEAASCSFFIMVFSVISSLKRSGVRPVS